MRKMRFTKLADRDAARRLVTIARTSCVRLFARMGVSAMTAM